MDSRKNLPEKLPAQELICSAKQRGSLVARGLSAVRDGTKLAQSKDNDTLYQQARAIFDRVGAVGNWTESRNPNISSAFKILQKLADGNYGKAYSPLSILMYFQNAPENRTRTSHYMRLAADWLDSHADEESWLYMGHMYISGCGVAQDDTQAAYWFRTAAERGNAIGQGLLGDMYETGRGVAQNDEQAAYWYRKAAEQGNPAAQWLLAGMYEYGRGVIPNVEQAIYWYQKAAENGDERALRDLDGIHEVGRGGSLDEDQAVYWNQKSAEEGHTWAMINLGSMYENGSRVCNDDEKALYWYRRAAGQGHPWTDADFGLDRFFKLGMRYRYGEDGTQVDNAKAREYFEEAAGPHTEALFELALLLDELGEWNEAQQCVDELVSAGYGPAIHYLVVVGNGLYGIDDDEQEQLQQKASEWYESRVRAGDAKRQFEFAELLLSFHQRHEGLRWLKASAKQDYSDACYRLGHEYLRPDVSNDLTQEAIYWLSRAAKLGRFLACEVLGDLYLLGHGRAPNNWTTPPPRITPDKATALAWYERAIAKGMRHVADKLGCYYLKGEHLDQDLALAEKWLLQAALDGSTSAAQTLGEEYASGTRLRQDANAAIYWLTQAAENYKSVGFKLAEIFADGIIIPVNFDEALKWLNHATASGGFRKEAMKVVTEKFCDGRFSLQQEAAAKECLMEMATRARALVADEEHQRYGSHAFRLAEHYELGIGVVHDMKEAIHWYTVSADEGLPGAQKRLKELGIDWEGS